MQCTVCKQFLPPGFTKVTEDNKAAKCIFCERDTLELKYVDENGKEQIASKFEIIKEYDKFIKQMKDNPQIKELILKDAIKKSMGK